MLILLELRRWPHRGHLCGDQLEDGDISDHIGGTEDTGQYAIKRQKYQPRLQQINR